MASGLLRLQLHAAGSRVRQPLRLLQRRGGLLHAGSRVRQPLRLLQRRGGLLHAGSRRRVRGSRFQGNWKGRIFGRTDLFNAYPIFGTFFGPRLKTEGTYRFSLVHPCVRSMIFSETPLKYFCETYEVKQP